MPEREGEGLKGTACEELIRPSIQTTVHLFVHSFTQEGFVPGPAAHGKAPVLWNLQAGDGNAFSLRQEPSPVPIILPWYRLI